MIGQAVREIDDARRSEEVSRLPTVKLRALVALVDASIEACEEVHLLRVKHPTAELVERGRAVASAAREVLTGDRGGDSAAAVQRLEQAEARRITELMDSLWTVQEAAFDALMPFRAALPDDAEEFDAAGWRAA